MSGPGATGAGGGLELGQSQQAGQAGDPAQIGRGPGAAAGPGGKLAPRVVERGPGPLGPQPGAEPRKCRAIDRQPVPGRQPDHPVRGPLHGRIMAPQGFPPGSRETKKRLEFAEKRAYSSPDSR